MTLSSFETKINCLVLFSVIKPLGFKLTVLHVFCKIKVLFLKVLISFGCLGFNVFIEELNSFSSLKLVISEVLVWFARTLFL